MKPKLSLKGRALKFLSAREHSRSELRAKLMRHALRDATQSSQAALASDDLDESLDSADDESQVKAGIGADVAAKVDALLDELEALRFLSNERFVESLSHRRAERYGSLRLAQDLKVHRIDSDLARAALSQARDTELARAHALWMRKFGEKADSPEGRMRQQRFLASRGFTPSVIHKVLKSGADGDLAGC